MKENQRICIAGIKLQKDEYISMFSNIKNMQNIVNKYDLSVFETSDGFAIIGYISKPDYFKEVESLQKLKIKYPLLSEKGLESHFFLVSK